MTKRNEEWVKWQRKELGLPTDSLSVSSKKKRGTRLPEDWDWKLPDQWRNIALKMGLSNEKIDIEKVNFKMYWLCKDKNATKLNWERTWQNWCIRVIHYGK